MALYGEFLLPSPIHESWRDYCMCLIFMIASITDFFDGFIARTYQITTNFGEIFDPLADKMLILSAFLVLLMFERANIWAIFLILNREFFITGLRVLAVSKGVKVAASPWGKYKTGLQIAAIGCLLMNLMEIGTVLLWCAVALTLYSGYDYLHSYLLKR